MSNSRSSIFSFSTALTLLQQTLPLAHQLIGQGMKGS